MKTKQPTNKLIFLNVIRRLEFEVVYYDVTEQCINQNIMDST